MLSAKKEVVADGENTDYKKDARFFSETQ